MFKPSPVEDSDAAARCGEAIDALSVRIFRFDPQIKFFAHGGSARCELGERAGTRARGPIVKFLLLCGAAPAYPSSSRRLRLRLGSV